MSCFLEGVQRTTWSTLAANYSLPMYAKFKISISVPPKVLPLRLHIETYQLGGRVLLVIGT